MIAWMQQLSNQFGNAYQYKMYVYTQTTSASGAQVSYLTAIDQDRIPLENYRVFKSYFSLV